MGRKKNNKQSRPQLSAVFDSFSQELSGIADRIADPIALRLQERETALEENAMTEFGAILMDGISKLFNKEDHADVTIRLGHIKLPAHGLVLSNQSPYFQKALCGKFAEGRTKEFSYSDHQHAHWRVFEYMYTGKYSDDIGVFGSIQDDDELMRPVHVYGLADYFDIDGLKKYALRSLQRLLTQTREGFVDCIRAVYCLNADSKDEMRALVVGVAYRHLRELMKEEGFRDLVHEGGDFAVELLVKVVY